jgi:hypothetical protein
VKARVVASAIRFASVERGKAGAERLGQLGLRRAGRAEVEAALDRLRQRCADARVGMPEQAGAVLAAEVDVAVPVEVGEGAALAAGHGGGERRVEQDGTGVAARHVPPGARMLRGAGRAGGGVALPRLGDGGVERDVGTPRERRHVWFPTGPHRFR